MQTLCVWFCYSVPDWTLHSYLWLFLLLVTTSCLPHFLCSGVLLADVLMRAYPVLFQKDVHRSSTQLFCCSLPQLFICSSIPELVASFSFCLWPQHKLCGCSGHTLMTCSVLVEIEPSASLGSFLRLFSSWVTTRTTKLLSEKGNAEAHPDLVIIDSSHNWWYKEAVQKNLPFLFPSHNKSKHYVSEVVEF